MSPTYNRRQDDERILRLEEWAKQGIAEHEDFKRRLGAIERDMRIGESEVRTELRQVRAGLDELREDVREDWKQMHADNLARFDRMEASQHVTTVQLTELVRAKDKLDGGMTVMKEIYVFLHSKLGRTFLLLLGLAALLRSASPERMERLSAWLFGG